MPLLFSLGFLSEWPLMLLCSPHVSILGTPVYPPEVLWQVKEFSVSSSDVPGCSTEEQF